MDIDQWAPRVAARRQLIWAATDWGGRGAHSRLDSQQGRDLRRSADLMRPACPLNIGIAYPQCYRGRAPPPGLVGW